MQSVHLIQQVIQERVALPRMGPFFRDEIHILENDGCWLQHARHGARRSNEPEVRARQKNDGTISHLRRQIHRRQRLSCSRRAVEEQPALQMTARGQQPIAQLRESRREERLLQRHEDLAPIREGRKDPLRLTVALNAQ